MAIPWILIRVAPAKGKLRIEWFCGSLAVSFLLEDDKDFVLDCKSLNDFDLSFGEPFSIQLQYGGPLVLLDSMILAALP